MTNKCVVCGSLFESKTDRAKYCCKKCANHSRFTRTHEQICEQNEKLKKEIERLYNFGLTDKGIAEKVGRSVSWVRQHRVEMGIARHRKVVKDLWQPELRICKGCQTVFISKTDNQLFCSTSCQRHYSHQIHDIKRKRRIVAAYVDDIALDDLYKRENGICYLCGKKCDYSDVKYIDGKRYALGNYPSREHIKPLAKDGLHTWDNVRLAHIRCNSSKGVRYG